MIRARFKVRGDDPRPVSWPIKHPYWVTGEGDDYFVLVAYADDEDQLQAQWPDAEEVDADDAEDYKFTDRFPKPDWFQGSAP